MADTKGARLNALCCSLRLRLGLWLGALVIGFSLLTAVHTHIENEARGRARLDDELARTAALLRHAAPEGLTEEGQIRSGRPSRMADPDRSPPAKDKAPVSRHGRSLTFAPLPLPAGASSFLQDLAARTQHLPAGYHDVELGDEIWRVLRVLPEGETQPAPAAPPDGMGPDAREPQSGLLVAGPAGVAAHLALRSALNAALPYLGLLCLLLGGMALVLRQLFQPVQELARELDCRREDDLRPVTGSEAGQKLPSELWPFVAAFDRLLVRVDQSMDGQRRFVADAAHELRTPLSALLLQVEQLAGREGAEAEEARAALQAGLLRARRLVNQLLDCGRAREGQLGPCEAVRVADLVRDVLGEALPEAEARNQDLGLILGRDAALDEDGAVCSDLSPEDRPNQGEGGCAEGEPGLGTDPIEDAVLQLPPLALRLILRNLLENALRHCPPGSKVDVVLRREAGALVVEVRDTGPGLDEGELARVLEPFYRTLAAQHAATPGSGLGLALVRTLAEALGAELRLGPAREKKPRGLAVRLRFFSFT